MFRNINSDYKFLIIDEIGELVYANKLDKDEEYDYLMIANHLYNAVKGLKCFRESIFEFDFIKVLFVNLGDYFFAFFYSHIYDRYEYEKLKKNIKNIIEE